MEILKNKKQLNDWIINNMVLIEVALLIILCVLHSLSAGHYANYFPINGTFQNYNPVRRLLDGQIPYRNFTDYLGLGHLYLGTLMTLVFGGDYQGSLIAFTFLTILSFSLISIVLSKAILGSWKWACGLTDIVLIIILCKPYGFATRFQVIWALDCARTVGNSARFIRGIILPISVLLVICLIELIGRKKDFLGEHFCETLFFIGIGTIAAISFIWSNDYGISVYVCILIMVFWGSISRYRSIKRMGINLVITFFSSICGIFLLVSILSFGNFVGWLKATFGTGGYQSWYYNGRKSYYYYDVDLSMIHIIQAIITLVYLLLVFKNKGSKAALLRYGIPAFCNMAAYCAVNEYKLLSGGANKEVATVVIALTVAFEAFLYFERKWKKLVRVGIVATLFGGLVWITYTVFNEISFKVSPEKEGIYFASLGGNVTDRAEDLLNAHLFLEGEKVFSTYASAQEVIENKYQPSGIDYIIHVLGDEERDSYLNCFREGDFTYVATMRKDFTEWEYWVERANWFFYRELYNDWHPCYMNDYEVYWEKNNTDDQYTITGDFDVKIIRDNESTVRLKIETDEEYSGYADVFVDYSVNKKNRKRAKMLFTTNLKVQNVGALAAEKSTFESNFLRPTGREYIPMPIKNGVGELTLTSCPSESTFLTINEVECNNIYQSAYFLPDYDN